MYKHLPTEKLKDKYGITWRPVFEFCEKELSIQWLEWTSLSKTKGRYLDIDEIFERCYSLLRDKVEYCKQFHIKKFDNGGYHIGRCCLDNKFDTIPELDVTKRALVVLGNGSLPLRRRREVLN